MYIRVRGPLFVALLMPALQCEAAVSMTRHPRMSCGVPPGGLDLIDVLD